MRLLENDNIRLRPVEATDVDVILEFENDSSEWRSASTVAPYSRRQIEEYVAAYRADIYSERQLRLIVERKDDMKVIGLVDLYDYNPVNARAMVGIYIESDSRHMGVGEEALALLAQYAGLHIGMHQLAAVIAEDNVASLSLFKAAGYTTCGKLRSWYARNERRGYADAYIVQKLLVDLRQS